MLTRRDIFKKLSDRCLNENDAVSAKIQNIIRNPTLLDWVEEMPVIPDLLLTLLGFEDLELLVTKDFVWEYWSKSLVEDEKSFPDVTEIADLVEVEEHLHRFGEVGLRLPINSIKKLRMAHERCRRRRFHR